MTDALDQAGKDLVKVALIGCPFDQGAAEPGARMGPSALRVARLAETLGELGVEVIDHGDLPAPEAIAALSLRPATNQMRQLPLVAAWCRQISRHAYDVMRGGATPVFLGGDHSISMGTVNGVARHAAEIGRELRVLWLDAHADFNTPASTPSGNMHGMSLALLAGEAGLGDVFGDEPTAQVKLDHLHLFGIRSIDTAERQSLRARGVDVVDMRLIDEFGVAALLRRILDEVRTSDAMLHVSLDVDFLDPAIAPGVGTTVPGGATYREAHLAMEMLHDSGLVTSLDVVELNPFLDIRGQSALLLVDLIGSLFGRQIMHR